MLDYLVAGHGREGRVIRLYETSHVKRPDDHSAVPDSAQSAKSNL